jgi:hypothetical protein
MAHFVKLGKGNIVTHGVVVNNDVFETEQEGVDFINNLYGTPNDVWKQTSYNTWMGEHKLGGTPFRKNYAGLGYKYDEDRDAFIPPRPFDTWTLNEDTCHWEAPVAYPDDGNRYLWNEETQTWDAVEAE